MVVMVTDWCEQIFPFCLPSEKVGVEMKAGWWPAGLERFAFG